MKKRKTKPMVKIESIGELSSFGWQDAIITFDGESYKVPGHANPQSVAASVFRSEGGEVLCTRERDFGGCGKDAVKPEIVPFHIYLIEYGEKL